MRALLLLSGGIDSPVAGHLIQQRGIDVSSVHFSYEPFVGSEAADKSALLARQLGFSPHTTVAFGPVLKDIVEKCDRKLYFVLSKRFMYRIAERIAQRDGCKFLVTGESVGQVSSQTLSNLASINTAVAMPVVRPVVGMDKEEIIALAKSIDTFETSKGPEVCDVLGPKHPATRSQATVVEEVEAALDIDVLVEQAVRTAK